MLCGPNLDSEVRCCLFCYNFAIAFNGIRELTEWSNHG